MNGPFPIPTATYRLQLNRSFTFRDATAIVSYLSSLGISHCYVSPYLRARPGSMHGYDIIDHNALNPELGPPEDYEQFVNELNRHGMGQILDIVPNHMGVMGSDNAWWLDVLENGEASEYASYFDIDWDPIKDELQGKVLIPILADQYGDVLERGELKLTFDPDRGEFSIFYFEHRFPVDPKEYPRILAFQLDRLQEKLGATNPAATNLTATNLGIANDDLLELQSIATAFSHLPSGRGLSAEKRAERNREKEVQKRRLAALCARAPETAAFLQANIDALNGTPTDFQSTDSHGDDPNANDPHSGDPRNADPQRFDALHELIKTQSFRLAQWRVAGDDINYRRFFDINDLAALRMENDAVFAQTHRFILELAAQGKVDGFRIDHPDGLYDPSKYLRQLTEQIMLARNGIAVNVAERHDEPSPFYLIVEKILTGKERLRSDWPIDGTTGYEFSSLVNGLFVDQTAHRKMERIYRSFCGQSVPAEAPQYIDLVYACKKLILKAVLASELNVLANLLSRIALANRHTCDFTLNSLRSALAEIIACFPVYRTYVSGNEVSSEDRAYVEQAIAAARRRSNAADLSVFDFIRRILLVEINGSQSSSCGPAVIRFAMKFQQVTAAVMAKGVEDTAFYRYANLISLNEVGGSPSKFGASVDEFHLANQDRLASWPHSMLSSSTHDSKRSEDVRTRIDVLSEIPAEWRLRLRRWRQLNRSKKRLVDGESAPARNDEYFLYQTLLGTWPLDSTDVDGIGNAAWAEFSQRIEQYLLKAAREAKEHTSWANANQEYEAALSKFTRTVLARTSGRTTKDPFLAEFADFARRIARVGHLNSLSQCLLKLTSPGVPDIYQGNELLQFNLVDPDNRRPVDYALRQKLLGQMTNALGGELCQDAHSSPAILGRVGALLADPGLGELKLYLIWKTLGLRKSAPSLFEQGTYNPLQVSGEKSNHVIAFARHYENQTILVVAPRLCFSLISDAADAADAVWARSASDTSVGNSSASGGSESTKSSWGTTHLDLSGLKGNGCYHNIFTGECLSLIDGRNRPLIAALLDRFPVALFVSQSL